MLHLCAVLLVLPHMCRGSVGFASHSASSATSAPRSRGAADSAFICWFCYTFTRFCLLCLSLGAVLLVLPCTPRGLASSARLCWFCIIHMVPIVLVLLFCFAFRTLLVSLLRISRCSLDSSPHASALGTIGALLASEPRVSRRWIYDYTSGSVSHCFFIVF